MAILFVFLLLLPGVAWFAGLDFGVNINRLGLKFPQPYGRALLDSDYYRAFDQYFDDRFSLRGPLILAKNWFDFHVFRTTDAADVHVGRGGWLYSRKSIADYRKADLAKDASIDWLVLQLHALEKIITASDRRFLFIVAPNKATVYPEFLGLAPEANNGGRSQYDLLLEHLDRHPLKDFVRLDEVMMAAKKSHVMLYDKAHAHWNGLGALVAAESIYHQIHEDDFTLRSLDYISSDDDQPGDLAVQLMGLAAEVVDTPFRQLAGSNRPDTPTGILYGDFFQRNLFPYMAQMFKQLDVVQADRIPSIQHKEDWRAYEYILIESGESELESLYIELDMIYSMLESEARITRRIALDLTAVAPVSQTSLRSRPDGLEIKSLGARSAFELIAVPASDHHVFRVLKLSLAALQSDRMTIQYQTPLRYAAAKSIKPGRSEFYLPLPFQESVSLRFYPGDKAGLFLLRAAEVIEFSDRPEPDIQPLKETTAAGEPPEAVESNAALSVDATDMDFSRSVDGRPAELSDRPVDFPLARLYANVTDVAVEGLPPGDAAYLSSISYLNGEVESDRELAANYPHTAVESPKFAADSDFTSESEILPNHGRAAEADSYFAGESHIAPDQDLVAAVDPDFSNKSEILPDHDRVLEGSVLPGSDKKQPHAAKDDLTEDKLTSADNEPSETFDAGSTSQTDDIVPQSGDAEDITKFKPVVPVKVEKTVENQPSITLTDFADGRIFQRKAGLADIVVSGTYTGPAGTIEARVVKEDGIEEIVPWTLIDDSPRNGIFVGVLSGVPQGGWYHLQVRFGRVHSVSDRGSHKWGVGILIACLGQSNMKEWFHTGESFIAHSMIRKYSDNGWTAPGTKGNGAIAFGNRLVESLGIPVGLLDYSVNGSGLRKEADWGTGYWENTAPDSIYSRFVDGVSKVGGAVEFVIWFQGEADAARKTVTETEYRDSLESFVTNQVRAHIDDGSDRQHLPFLVVMLTRRPGGYDEPHQAIRNAQKHIIENVAECYPAATTLDLKNRGKQHMHPDAYTAMGRRVAQTVLYILGQAQYYRGPTATAARQINDRRIDVSIQHRGGADFTPASGISGWEILVDETPLSIADVKRHDPSTISIILESPLIENATVRYLYGAMPDTRSPVVDNSALSLPLEEFQSQVQ